MKMIALLALAIFIQQDGCSPDPAPQPQSATRPVPTRECAATHRFTSLDVNPMVRGDVAFDTCTGKLCKTWDWVSTNKGIQGGYGSLPFCSDLAANSAP